MPLDPHRRSARGERGSAIVIAAVSFLVLCGFAALVIDLGYVGVVESQLQTSTDAAAMGAARLLDGSATGYRPARSAAVELAGVNPSDGAAVLRDRNDANAAVGDVVLGIWDGAAFTPDDSDPAVVNAVLVRTENQDLVPFFARIAFGRGSLGCAVESVAAAPPPAQAAAVPWCLPFGLPDCLWDSYTPVELQDMVFVLRPAGADNTGWAAVNGSPNASWVRDFIQTISPCMQEWAATGEVDEPCADASVDDPVDLHNGELQAAQNYMASQIGELGIPWDSELWGELPAQDPDSLVQASEYGHTHVGPIPVFDSGEGCCTEGGGSWTETSTATGFAWAVIYDIVKGTGAAEHPVHLRIDLDSYDNIGDWPSTSVVDHGVQADTPVRMVQ